MARPLESVRDVSRIGYAFMSSQALFAALELGLFTELDRSPLPQMISQPSWRLYPKRFKRFLRTSLPKS